MVSVLPRGLGVQTGDSVPVHFAASWLPGCHELLSTVGTGPA